MKKGIMKSESMKLFSMLAGYFLSLLLLFSIFSFIKCINLSFIQIISVIIPVIIYLMIIFGAFYLGFGKRRNEIIKNGERGRLYLL